MSTDPDSPAQAPPEPRFAGLMFRPDGRLRAGWRFGLGLLVLAASEMLGAAAASFIPRGHPLVTETVYRAAALAALLGGFCFLLITADGVEERPLASLGLAWERPGARQAGWGVAIGCAMVLVAVAVMAVAASLTLHVVVSRRTLSHAALGLALIAVAAMGEEAMFRGYPFQRLVEGAGPAAAVLLTSVFFGFVHGDNPSVSRWAIANTVLFGVLLAIAYLRSRSLWMPWGIHFGWNALLGLGFGLPLSGLTMFAIVVRARAAGPHWITGGAYGIEGGALGTILILASIPLVYWAAGKLRAPVSQPADERLNLG